MKLRVWKWHHDWEDDSDTSLYPSEAAAIQAVQIYVRNSWDVEGEGCPDDDAEAVVKYFQYNEDVEWYSISSQEVEFHNIPDVPEEEIVLNPDECAAVVALLEIPGVNAIVKNALNLNKLADANVITGSVYGKLKD